MRIRKTKYMRIIPMGIIVSLCIVFTIFFYIRQKRIESVQDPIQNICDQIEKDNYQIQTMDLETIHTVYTELLAKEERYQKLYDSEDKLAALEALTAEEYFILGYYEYKQYEDEKATHHLEQSMNLYTDTTEGSIKLSTGIYLSVMNGDNIEATIQQMSQIFDSLSTADWNHQIEYINTYMNSIIDHRAGRDYLTGYLKEKLLHKEKLSVEAELNLRNSLCMCYGAAGHYARALEQCLTVISIAESSGNTYFAAKAYVDMSALYNAMDRYEIGEKWAQKMLDFKNGSEIETQFIRAYALQNILQSLYGQNKYEECITYAKRLEALYPSFDDYEVAAYQVSLKLYEAQCRIRLGEIEKAKDLIEKSEDKLDLVRYSTTVSIPIMYKTVKGRYYLAIGKMEEATSLFLEALDLSEPDASYNLTILKDLVKAYEGTGDIHLLKKYSIWLFQMYEDETVMLNEEYCDYTVQKYHAYKDNLILQRKIIHERTHWVIFIACGALCVIFLIMKIEYIKCINRMDGLSRCYNRNYFDRKYQKWNMRHPIQLIMFDIDDFKQINDEYGHTSGDEVIRQLGAIVKKVVGKKGKVFRYGGEEFVVITRLQSMEQAEVMAELIRTTVETAQWKKVDKVTISLGVADASRTVWDLVKIADQRLYQSKSKGKNCTTGK